MRPPPCCCTRKASSSTSCSAIDGKRKRPAQRRAAACGSRSRICARRCAANWRNPGPRRISLSSVTATCNSMPASRNSPAHAPPSTTRWPPPWSRCGKNCRRTPRCSISSPSPPGSVAGDGSHATAWWCCVMAASRNSSSAGTRRPRWMSLPATSAPPCRRRAIRRRRTMPSTRCTTLFTK